MRRRSPLRDLRPRLRQRDLLGEALAGTLARPSRAVLTALATVLGIGSLVATIGLTSTASAQIISRFDRFATDAVHVSRAREVPTGRVALDELAARTAAAIPFDAEARLTRLNGVAAAGTYSELGTFELATTPVRDVHRTGTAEAPVVAVSPGLLDAVGATLASGRAFDAGHDLRGDRVALLGRELAGRLNVHRVDAAPAVSIGGARFSVVGIIDGAPARAGLVGAVVVPDGAARAVLGLAAPQSVEVLADRGAAALVREQAPVVLSPNDPGLLVAASPPEPVAVRAEVAGDTRLLLLVLGLTALVVGALGLANTTLLSVIERTGEIGLRRALGARRHHIAAQFLGEATLLGAGGGVIGASLGVVVVVAASLFNQWQPLIPAWAWPAGPALGALVGALAGTYPAVAAARVEPVQALRHG